MCYNMLNLTIDLIKGIGNVNYYAHKSVITQNIKIEIHVPLRYGAWQVPPFQVLLNTSYFILFYNINRKIYESYDPNEYVQLMKSIKIIVEKCYVILL